MLNAWGNGKRFNGCKKNSEFKKGLFYPDSDYGVASYPLDESEAACLASEALKRADGVFVVAAEKNKNKYEITLIICGEERTVSVEF